MRSILKLFIIILIIAVGYVFIFKNPDIPASVLTEKYGQPPSKIIQLPSGVKVNYRDEGNPNGKPLVLLHGSNASLYVWVPWVKILGKDFRIISVDLPGHGLTGPVLNGDYSTVGMANFVNEFANTLGLKKFALAGNSMGGNVAARFALMFPDRLDHLILLDASGIPSKKPTEKSLAFFIMTTPILQKISLYLSPRFLYENILKSTVANPKVITKEDVDRTWELNRLTGEREATLKRFQTPNDRYVEQNASKITVPTLIIWGEKDTVTPPDVAEAYHDAIKGSKLIIYKDVGHSPMIEVPQKSAEDVKAFLNS